MKRFFLFSISIAVASSSFAYYGDYSSPKFELPGWLTFMGIIMIAWGILEIILFFKIWGMTNDIKALKMDHFNESNNTNDFLILEELRNNFVLGNIDNVKKTLLKNFIQSVQSSFGQLPSAGYEKDEDGNTKWVNFKDRNKEKSIRPYVDNLQKQFNKIGEELPEYIKRMETYRDYFDLFIEEDLAIKKEENVETPIEKETIAPLTNPEYNNKDYAERNDEGNEQVTEKIEIPSNRNLYLITIPIITSLAFLVGVAIFHAHYQYYDWWVEESSILVPTFIVFAVILGIYYAIYYAIVNNMKKKTS